MKNKLSKIGIWRSISSNGVRNNYNYNFCTVTPDTRCLFFPRDSAEREELFRKSLRVHIDRRKKKGEHFSQILFMWTRWPTTCLPAAAIGTNIFAVILAAPLGILSRFSFRIRRHYSLMRHYIGYGLLMVAVFLGASTKPFQLMRSNRVGISRSSLIRPIRV